MMNAKQNRSGNKIGFTLIELLVTVSIIGVLVALLLVNFVGIRERGADAKRKAEMDQLKKALQLYYNDYQAYPGASGNQVAGCGASGTTQCGLGFQTPNVNYMKLLPEDYAYYSDSANQFVGVTTLQNPSDQDVANSHARCASSIAALNVTVGEMDFVVCED